MRNLKQYSFFFCKVIITLSLVAIFTASFATDYTWVSTSSTDWGTADNWSPNGVPDDPSDNVTINGGGTANLILDINRSIGNFTFNTKTLDLNAKTLTVSGTVTISGGTITGDGNLEMTGGTLNITGGTVSLTGDLKLGTSTTPATLTNLGLSGAGPTIGSTTYINTNTLTLRNTTFNNSTKVITIKVNNTSNNSNLGPATFNGPTTIEAASSGYLLLSALGSFTYNNDITFINSGTGRIYTGHSAGDYYNSTGKITFTCLNNSIYVNHAGSATFNKNVELNCTGPGGILFGQSGGITTLANGVLLTIPTNGFNLGTLHLRNIIQAPGTTTDQSLILTGSTTPETTTLTLGPGNIFRGSVNFKAPNMYLNGSEYWGTATFEKTGGNANSGAGGNIFHSTAELKNSTSLGYLATGNLTPDIFNGPLTLTNTNSNVLYIAFNTAGTKLNSNVSFNNTGTGSIRIGHGLSSSATLEAGSTLNTGSPGVTAGNIILNKLTQLGSTSQSLTFTGGTLTINDGCVFNGSLTVSSPNVFINGGTFYSSVNATKTSSNSNTWTGSTVNFKSDVTITNSNTGALSLGNVGTDVFNFEGNVTFVKGSTGGIVPSRAGATNFYGNVTYNSLSGTPSTFGSTLGGITYFKGSNSQTVSSSTSSNLNFNKVVIDKTSNHVTLGVKMTITAVGASTADLILTKGNLITTSTNYPLLPDNVVLTGGSANSFISGPVRKAGDDPFTFPVGKGSSYRPISIMNPGLVSDAFTAEYFNAAPVDPNLISGKSISNCEYWNLERVGSSNVKVSLEWNTTTCNTSQPSSIAKYNTTNSTWELEAGTTTGNASSGSIQSNANLNSFGYITLAYDCNLNITSNSTPVCGTQNGNINVSINNGTAPFTYLWNHGPTTEDVSVNAAGSYSVTVTDGAGCQDSENFSINSSPALVVSYVTDETSASITTTGGDSPYSYLWSNGATSSSQNNLSPGSYTVTITDDIGCSVSLGIVIMLPKGYAEVKKKLDGGFYTTVNGKLFFKYSEEYADATLTYKILDYKKEPMNISYTQERKYGDNLMRKYGDNYYSLNLSNCSYNLVDGDFYILELTNDKKEVFVLRFKYVRPTGLPSCN